VDREEFCTHDLDPDAPCFCPDCAPYRPWQVLTLTVCAGLFLLGLLALASYGCVSGSGPTPPTTHPPPFNEAARTADCQRIWLTELQRAIDQGGLSGCLANFRAGATEAQIVANIRLSAEWQHLHAPHPPASIVKGRLHTTPAGFFYPDGSRFRWQGITAFGLLEEVAHGRENDAVAWMKARRTDGVKVVRPLAMNHGDVQWQKLPPEDGRAALPRLLELAKQADLYVEIVALAGTKDRPSSFLDDQVRAIGTICAAHNNCVLEIANEPYHSSQHSSLKLPSTAKRLRALVPAGVPVAYGAARTDEIVDTAPKVEGKTDDGSLYCEASDFITLHRKRNADIWDDQRRFTELAKVAAKCKKPVIDNEGYGFAETPVVGTNSRRTEAYAGFGQGYLSRMFEIGSNFHCEDGITTSPLRPLQLAALRAFTSATADVPYALVFKFANGKSGDSAVKDASFIGPSCSSCAVMRGFSFFAPGYNRFVWVGLKPGRDPMPKWQGGWKAGLIVNDVPGMRVLEITK
jgi:hypothetical protein